MWIELLSDCGSQLEPVHLATSLESKANLRHLACFNQITKCPLFCILLGLAEYGSWLTIALLSCACDACAGLDSLEASLSFRDSSSYFQCLGLFSPTSFCLCLLFEVPFLLSVQKSSSPLYCFESIVDLDALLVSHSSAWSSIAVICC